jgi:hypothetical protein
MTPHAQGSRRRLRAAIIGLGPDGQDGPYRVISGTQCLMMGGSAEAHAELLETMLRLDSELERLGLGLAEVEPAELAEIAWRIDSPELHEIAIRMEDGLARRGRSFQESTAEELTELATGLGA